MPLDASGGLFLGAVALGLLHGIEPGHGWPLAAAYGLARPAKYVSGTLAALVLGVGHLVSSIAMVLLFFAAKEYFELARLGWLAPAAGGLLIALGLWELVRHHRARRRGGHAHGCTGDAQAAEGRGLWSLAGAAFALGFAHEEEFEIIGLCAGSEHCLGLMLAYATAVIVAIVALTTLLVAGYRRYEARLRSYAPHLPKLSAAVLMAMGLGFIVGVF